MRLQNILICILLAAIGTVPIGCITAKKSRLQTGGPEQPKVRRISAEEERTIMEQTNKMFAVGLAAEQQGDLKAAEWAYVQCLQYNQKKESVKFVGPPYHRLAVITARQGNTEKSEQYFRKALEFGSENPELACDFAQMLIDDGREKEATTILENALIADPKNKKLLFFLGHTLAIQNREIEALRRFKVAVGEGAAYHELAQILREKGNSRGAELMEEKGRIAQLENRKPINDVKERLKNELNQELTDGSSMELLTYSSKTPKMGSINRRYMGILEGNEESIPKPDTSIAAAPEINPAEVMQKYGRPEFVEAPIPNPPVSTAQPKFSDIHSNRSAIAGRPLDESYPAPATLGAALPAAPPVPPRQMLAARPDRDIAVPSETVVQPQKKPSASELLAEAGKVSKPIAVATPNLEFPKDATVFEPPNPNTDFAGKLLGDIQPVQQAPPQIAPAIPALTPTKKELEDFDPFKPETESVKSELLKIALRENSMDRGVASTKSHSIAAPESEKPDEAHKPLPFEDNFLNTPIEPVFPPLESTPEPPKENVPPADEVLPNLTLGSETSKSQVQTSPTLPDKIPNPRLDLQVGLNPPLVQTPIPPQPQAQDQAQSQPQPQVQANAPKPANRATTPKSGQYSTFGPSQRKPIAVGGTSANSRPTQIAIAAPSKQELPTNTPMELKSETPPVSTLIVETPTIPETTVPSEKKEMPTQAAPAIPGLKPEERFADKIGLPRLDPKVAMRMDSVPAIASTNEPIVQKLEEPKVELKIEPKVEPKPEPQPEPQPAVKTESKPKPTPTPSAPTVDQIVEKTVEPKIEPKAAPDVPSKQQTALPLEKPRNRTAERKIAVRPEAPKTEPSKVKPSQPEPTKPVPADSPIALNAESRKTEVAESGSLQLPMPQLELLTKLYGPNRPEQRPAPPVIPPTASVEVKQAKPEPKVAIADPAKIESRKSLTFNDAPRSQAKSAKTESTKGDRESTVFAPVPTKSLESEMKIVLSPPTETVPNIEPPSENATPKQVLKIVDAKELKSLKRQENDSEGHETEIDEEVGGERVVVKLGSTPEESTRSPRNGNKPVSFTGEIVQLKIERPWDATDSEADSALKSQPKTVEKPARNSESKAAPKKLLKVQSGSKSAGTPTIELKSTSARSLSVRSLDVESARPSDAKNDPNRKELTLKM